MSPAAWLLRAFVLFYRWVIRPFMGPPRCRFHPSCSHYALDALATHGAVYGGWLCVRRLARCHPWGGSGYDPVPPVRQTAAGDGKCCGGH